MRRARAASTFWDRTQTSWMAGPSPAMTWLDYKRLACASSLRIVIPRCPDTARASKDALPGGVSDLSVEARGARISG